LTTEGAQQNNVLIDVGKETDRAVADVVRGLLKRPAEEVGNLLADGLGLLADQVRLKRALNAQLGLERVKEKLEEREVDVDNTSSPEEEELHLLLNGMSLAGNEHVRNMWAGLFAEALDPASGVSAERPFIAVLESLTPTDAKIIDLLIYIEQIKASWQRRKAKFIPPNPASMSDEEKARLKETQELNQELLKRATAAIWKKAEAYGLAQIEEDGWAENLFRQGVVERSPLPEVLSSRFSNYPHFGDVDVSRIVAGLQKKLESFDMKMKRETTAPSLILSGSRQEGRWTQEVILTSFGRRFAAACGLDANKDLEI